MSQNTQQTIDSLIADLVPVRPARPLLLLVMWTAIAIVLGVVLSVVLKPRYDFFEQIQGGPFLAASVLLILSFLFASWIAIKGAVPGGFRRGALWTAWAMVSAFVAYFFLYGVIVQGASPEYSTYSGYHTLRCCFLIATGTVVSSVVLLALVARLAPLDFAVAAIRALFTSFLVGSVVGVVICPFDNITHRVLGHLALPLVISLVVYFPLERLLQRLYRRQASTRSARLFR